MDSSPEDGSDTLSKKRAAFFQQSKSNDLDVEEITPHTDTGTFERANDEVLASRRILNVSRAAPASSAPNAFVSISLVPPSDLIIETETPGNEEFSWDERKDAIPGEFTKDQNAEKNQFLQNEHYHFVVAEVKSGISVGASHETITGQHESTANTVAVTRNGETDVSQSREHVGNGVAETNRKAESSVGAEAVPNTSFLSFQQHCTGKNAFSGSFGTGFSTSSFSFGVTPSPSASPVDFSSFRSRPSPSLGSTSFGSSPSTENEIPSPFDQNNSSVVASFQLCGSSATVSLSEVAVETGEEKERVIFTTYVTLFEFVDNTWRERGKGELRVNLTEETEHKARLVMRSKGNLRLLLNASLFPDMRLNMMNNTSVTFACANSASTFNVGGLTTHALKFKDARVARSFFAIVESHKVPYIETRAQRIPPEKSKGEGRS